MKKLILEFLLPIIGPIISAAIKELVEYVFGKYANNSLRDCRVLMVSFYPILDGPIERAVIKTLNGFDDTAVKAFKEGMEVVAKKHNIQLPELDNDKGK
jgi:hypothetical protein